MLRILLWCLFAAAVSMAWRQERIQRAHTVQRPIDHKWGNTLNKVGINHRGVVVETTGGNKYLIHNTPKTGVVATGAEHMSSKWKNTGEIHMGSHGHTVGQVISDAAGLGKTSSPQVNYLASGTCIGAAKNAATSLEGK